MTANEARKKSISELHKQVLASKKELFKLDLEIKAGKSAKIDKKKEIKKDIAVLKTVISEKEILKENEKA